MPSFVLAALSREWAGLAAAAVAAAISAFTHGPWRVALALLAVALAAGSAVHLRRLAQTRRAHPPPGTLVDVGGYRIHVVAEGAANGRRPVVWLGGSHAAGLTMQHLHERLRVDTRSILIDRPGTGWSETGPFPRTTAREAEEMIAALDALPGALGPKPVPFVLVGYSFGGLLAANIARRFPERLATLVLLDPTPLETIIFGPRLGALSEMRRDALGTALLRLLGFPANLETRRARRTTAHADAIGRFEAELGGALTTLRAIEVSAGSQLAGYSIYQELSPTGAAARGWETVVYDADLGDLPVLLVAPGSADEIASLPEVAAQSEREAARSHRFFERSRERYLASSTQSRRVITPKGTTHQVVYETPDFVADLVRLII